MQGKPQMTRRSVLTATGTLSVLGLAGVASGDESPDGDDVPTLDDDGGESFPTIGENADAPTATVYSNVKCPYTQEFVFGNLEAIVEEFVATGRLNLKFCSLSYEPGDSSTPYISSSDPRIAAVELAIWDEDPDSYWKFAFELYSDAPSGYVGFDELASRAQAAGVSNVETIIERARSGEYDDQVQAVADRAAEADVSFSPQLELAGETAAPHHDTESILSWIETQLEEAPADGEEEYEDTEYDETDDADSSDDAAEQPEDAQDAEDSDESGDGSEGAEEQPADDADEEPDESDEPADDTSDSDDSDESSTDDGSDTDTAPSTGDDSGSDSGIGAGLDYDLDSDRTLDDLPVDCD